MIEYAIIFLILMIILEVIYVFFYKKNEHESFDNFSPFIGNNDYPYVYQKNIDQKKLRQTLKQWEKPFNCNNEGYLNAEPTGLPPLVPLYSYVQRNEVEFNYLPPKINEEM
jgi:hypothetical protein